MAKIHTLKIKNFRGIEDFEQVFGMTNLVCLIGRGDSGKTTILEAISFVLSSQWNISFYDTDFFNCNTKKNIEIEATLYDLPKKFLTEDKFGLYIRGIDTNTNKIEDELKSNHIQAITVKLIVDKDLEPRWYITNSREQEDIEIKATERAMFNVSFISDYLDRHFTWSKGNPLYSLMKNEDIGISKSNIIIESTRTAKESIDTAGFQYLNEIEAKISSKFEDFGAGIINTKTSIDFKDIAIKDGKLCLHDDKIPFRQKGKGSKRLLSMAIQTEVSTNGGILLIDEVEQGLEPHRAKHLVQKLKQQTHEQIFLTTHSRDIVVELKAENLFLAHKGSKMLVCFDNTFQGCLRNNPEGFFAKKILICEGATEVGICRAINEFRVNIENKPSFAVLGIGIIDGKGASFISYCKKFKEAYFEVCVLCDSDDNSINAKKEELKRLGITVIDCDIDNAIENQIIKDLSWKSIVQLVEYAIEDKGEQSVISLIENQLSKKLQPNWRENEDENIRNAISKASTLKTKKENGEVVDKAWFKRIDHGEYLGQIICENKDIVSTKTIGKQLQSLFNWIEKNDEHQL